MERAPPRDVSPNPSGKFQGNGEDCRECLVLFTGPGTHTVAGRLNNLSISGGSSGGSCRYRRAFPLRGTLAALTLHLDQCL
jgi:hypothetical protein